MSNKKQSSKDLNLQITSAVNNVYNNAVKTHLNEVNGTMAELKEKNLKLMSHFIFNVYKEARTVDIKKLKTALKSQARKMPSLFNWIEDKNGKSRCDLFELLSAFTFSEFVESKIGDKTSVPAIRKALDKFKIEGLSGAVSLARKHKKATSPADTPSNNRPKIEQTAEKMEKLKLSANEVEEALLLLDIEEAMQICKRFVEANATIKQSKAS